MLVASFNHMVEYQFHIVAAAGQIAEGNLAQEISMASDEDVLGSALNRMIQSLRSLVGAVASNAEELKWASDQLAKSAAQSGSSTTQITRTMQEVASSATQTPGPSAQPPWRWTP